jgi:quinoprotein glucose dehydrogenase
MLMRSWSLFVVLAVGGVPATGQVPYRPAVAEASNEARNAIKKFTVPEDILVRLVAAEPDLANAVSFDIDRLGRLWVTETFRLHKGVTDNRNQAHHAEWLDLELACRTVADRVAMYRQVFGAEIADYEREHERIRLLEDTNGDGEVDRATVFADGFKDIADGIAAGVLEHDGEVFYTCIPKLWSLRDDDGDGRADRRQVLHDGFGVHTALLGHDMHGLIIGPDGRLYFSIGDRGLHVETANGTLALPDEGAVLRCELDGSGLEVFARGLRNPQELAFDRFGNLFTGDNNSDGGDRARWVYVVEGGSSGWQIGYQSLADRGPWNRERLWQPMFRGQAAWILPPIAHVGNGPSGLACDPGTGLPERYRDCFLLCDFLGSSARSGVRVLGVTPKGAGFELTRSDKLIWQVLATDVAFGPDGNVYLSDWIEGWNQPMKGRIYALEPRVRDPRSADVRRLLAGGVADRSETELAALLGHDDQRVRQRAQLALAARGANDALAAVARAPDRQLTRIHAIWGLGQILRRDTAADTEALRTLLDDPDGEIRAQAARVLGDARVAAAGTKLTGLLADTSSRVRFFAALALGKLGHGAALEPLLAMLEANADRDPFLRHAGVMGLAGIGDVPALLAHADAADAAARMGILLALRRLERAEIARFLDDPDPLLRVEAARAIHDVPIAGALTDLAAALVRADGEDEAFARRAVNANFRVADAACMQRLVALAGRATASAAARVDAMDALAAWENPSARDRVLNLWRPLPAPRPLDALREALATALPAVLADAPDEVREAAARTAQALGVAAATPALAALVGQTERADDARVAALRALRVLDPDRARAAMARAADDEREAVRKAGVRMLAELDPSAAVPVLEALAGKAPLAERQNALRALGGMRSPQAAAALGRWLDALDKGDVPLGLQLDLLEAAAAVDDPALTARLEQRQAALPQDGPLAAFRFALEGGDADAGKRVFYEHEVGQCRKCHRIDGDGADVGPDLSDVGKRLSRETLLESLVAPNTNVAAGFGSVVVTMRDATLHAGVLRDQTDAELRLVTADGDELTLPREAIESTSAPVSSMPPMGTILGKRELRDLIEYLAERRE